MKLRFAQLSAAALALLVPAVALADPPQASGFGMPHDASEYGHHIDRLILVSTFFIAALFIIMVGWMMLAVVRHNRGHVARYEHGGIKNTLILAFAIFAVVDGTLFTNTMLDLNAYFYNFNLPESSPQAVRIEVNGHQWAWTARYAGPDGKFNTADDIVTLNDFRVPVDTPVILQVASTDVIHSFYLPNFRAKIDAMPGMVNRLWFQPKEVGEYEIGCSQHCGANHYKMRAELRVLSKEDFARWAAEASANSQRAFDADDQTAHWGWDWAEHSRI